MIGLKKIVFVLIFVFFSSSFSYADCFSSASERYSIPSDILKAIAFAESSNNPFAVNVEGVPYYASGLFDAGQFISDNIDRSFDIGIMQVNRWWFDKMGVSYVVGLNQCLNIHFGAYILNYEIKRAKGDIWKAVGRYHSAKKGKQMRYIDKVKTVWLIAKKEKSDS